MLVQKVLNSFPDLALDLLVDVKLIAVPFDVAIQLLFKLLNLGVVILLMLNFGFKTVDLKHQTLPDILNLILKVLD